MINKLKTLAAAADAADGDAQCASRMYISYVSDDFPSRPASESSSKDKGASAKTFECVRRFPVLSVSLSLALAAMSKLIISRKFAASLLPRSGRCSSCSVTL